MEVKVEVEVEVEVEVKSLCKLCENLLIYIVGKAGARSTFSPTGPTPATETGKEGWEDRARYGDGKRL